MELKEKYYLYTLEYGERKGYSIKKVELYKNINDKIINYKFQPSHFNENVKININKDFDKVILHGYNFNKKSVFSMNENLKDIENIFINYFNDEFEKEMNEIKNGFERNNLCKNQNL